MNAMDHFIRIIIALLVSAAALSCAGKKSDLKKDLEEIADLIGSRDCAGLYACLSSEKKEVIGKEEFVELCKKDIGDMGRLFRHIEDAGKAKADIKIGYNAEIDLRDGGKVVLVCENGVWKINSDLIKFYPQSTPGEALSSFIKAFQAKRWDVLARFMPSKYTSEDDAKILEKHWSDPAVRAETEQLLMVLKDHLADTIKIDGNRAVMEFAPQHKVEMLKERGVWVIVHLY